MFYSRCSSLAKLCELVGEHALCLQARGFEWTHGVGRRCFRHQVGRYISAGQESTGAHRTQLVAGQRPLTWPYRGPIGVVEYDTERDPMEIHVIDRWRYLGLARNEAEPTQFLVDREHARFAIDQHQLLKRQRSLRPDFAA